MGGNAIVIDRQTNELTDIKAEPIFLKNIESLNYFKQNIKELLINLNELFYEKYNYFLWNDLNNLIEKCEIFNGSSKYFFDSSINEEEFLKFKPSMGDLDIMVDRDELKKLFDLLKENENKIITKHIEYKGQCKSEFYGYQINTVWSLNYFGNFQIDFEGVIFDCDKPTLFSKFSHSTSWEDIKKGFKGVHHKYLLMNIVRAISENDKILILTPKSSETVDNVKLKKMNEVPRMWAFSIDRGLREKYRKINLKFQGKDCYKELPTNDSNYITDPKDIFLSIFKKCEYDYNKFNSFIGLVEYLKQEFNEQMICKIFDYILTQLFGKNAQELYRDNLEKDREEKCKMIDYFTEYFSYLNNVNLNLKIMNKVFDFYKDFS